MAFVVACAALGISLLALRRVDNLIRSVDDAVNAAKEPRSMPDPHRTFGDVQ